MNKIRAWVSGVSLVCMSLTVLMDGYAGVNFSLSAPANGKNKSVAEISRVIELTRECIHTTPDFSGSCLTYNLILIDVLRAVYPNDKQCLMQVDISNTVTHFLVYSKRFKYLDAYPEGRGQENSFFPTDVIGVPVEDGLFVYVTRQYSDTITRAVKQCVQDAEYRNSTVGACVYIGSTDYVVPDTFFNKGAQWVTETVQAVTQAIKLRLPQKNTR